MSEEELTPEEGENTTPGDEGEDKEVLNGMIELFQTLVPENVVTISDGLGNEHKGRGRLVAKGQVVVMREMRKIWDMVPDGSDKANMETFVPMMVGFASNPEVLESICTSFKAAHPKVIKKAKEFFKAEDEPHSDVTDLFEIEEMVKALVPFFIRFAKTSADLVSRVTGKNKKPKSA